MNEPSSDVESDGLVDNDMNDEEEENSENYWNEGGSSGNVDNEELRGNEMAEWKVGDECVARWEEDGCRYKAVVEKVSWYEDGCWYKAVVERVEDETVVVNFTEFGNSASCTLENVKDPSTKISEDGQLVVEEDDANEWG